MKIVIGSTNPAKIQAVHDIFSNEEVSGIKVPSNVSAQPYSDTETRQGAINRALQCIESESSEIGIGLEGGVMYVDNQLFLCNWGALVTKENKLYTASGARIPLPQEFDKELQDGTELGDIMDRYARKKDVRKNEGAIGIFTNGHVSRKEMFVHVLKQLRGQWEFS